MTYSIDRSGELAALACPACEQCGAATRFVGLESHPDGKSDICTYECVSCTHVQVATFAHAEESAGGTHSATA